jgi:hypothetical protein
MQITSDNRSQWKLLLEQRATGYGWPIDSSGSAVKVVTSNNKLAAISHTSVGKFYSVLNTVSTKDVGSCSYKAYCFSPRLVDTLYIRCGFFVCQDKLVREVDNLYTLLLPSWYFMVNCKYSSTVKATKNQ